MHSVTYMYMRRCLREKVLLFRRHRSWDAPYWCQTAAEIVSRSLMAWTEKMCQLTPEGISAGIEELLSDEEKCREYCKKASEKLTAEKRRCPSDVSV